MVVPGCVAVNPEDPKRDPDVPPKGLEVVLVVPKSPPLLLLVPNAAGEFPREAWKQASAKLQQETFKDPAILSQSQEMHD